MIRKCQEYAIIQGIKGVKELKATYAVVDIETTGTDPEKDRMIQFGCVLVENGKIVQKFATDINPGKNIPPHIQSLTGISNSRVKKAPYFEDIAETIYYLLENTIFVAHNIHFDYRFLNHELVRCQMPALDLQGIDTVDLAQIFLPSEGSFRLGDLAESIGLANHEPHQADSDAQVTAALLLHIEQKMRHLPVVTLTEIAKRSDSLSMDTGNYIRKILKSIQTENQPLNKELQIIEGIALRKKEVTLFQSPTYESEYPKTKKGKERFFVSPYEYRKEQARLMNVVYKHFIETTEKNLLIEAETGMGKTMGYLFPISFFATPEEPVIISTASILLQNQLMEQEIPKVNEIVTYPIQATLVKSKRHYIDLQRFVDSLQLKINKKQYLRYQMSILVWLTETLTGDFGELNLLKLDDPFFEDVRHRGTNYLDRSRKLYAHDFLLYLEKKVKQSNVLIVNHAFLAQETQRKYPVLPESRWLLIDEAHHLPENLEWVSDYFFDTQRFRKQVYQLTETDNIFEQLTEMFEIDPIAIQTVQLYKEILQSTLHLQNEFVEEWQLHFSREVDQQVTNEQLLIFSSIEKKWRKLLLYYNELQLLQEQICTSGERIYFSWFTKQQFIYSKLLTFFEKINDQANLFNQWFRPVAPSCLRRLYLYPGTTEARFQIVDFEAGSVLQTAWYPRYQKIIYLGGTISVSGNRQYLAKRLGIPETKLTIIPTTYDYQQQARILVLNEGRSISELTTEEAAKELAYQLKIVLQEIEQPVLVLFTSHELLRKVYGKLQPIFLNKNREIFAQGIGGSREKLLKRFMHSSAGILFGADSFWEGVDLPGDTLQLLVVTRLPFENPARSLTKARYHYLKENGVDPFQKDSLPRTALKLRQALGRLIRSDKDKGILLIFDRRIVTKKYGKRLMRSFPKELPVQEMSLLEMQEEIKLFLNEKET